MKNIDSTAAALTILGRKSSYQAAEQAVRYLIENPDAAAHDALVETYNRYDAGGGRDGMGELRALVLTALRPIATRADIPLLERALMTYKIVNAPFNPDYMVGLRAAALYALNQIDDERASYHAVRLLVDPYASKTSGEPALTAVRVLAAQQNGLALYQFALGIELEGFHGQVAAEVLSDCIAHLHLLPLPLLEQIVARYGATEDEIVMLGVLDLLVKVRPYSHLLSKMQHFIHETQNVDLFRYFLHIVAANRDGELVRLLLPELEWVDGDEKMAVVTEVMPALRELL